MMTLIHMTYIDCENQTFEEEEEEEYMKKGVR